MMAQLFSYYVPDYTPMLSDVIDKMFKTDFSPYVSKVSSPHPILMGVNETSLKCKQG